ncbi:TonB-dependent receptor [Pseudoflavitalea sp. G-6-1-2]|uniref:SusC/RagA family TonB-linked outer membrane protein n=1 Tax=Pseudoflavitalea sp. G-6-1-2 TaxID=2728841 RepID=UPI001469F039|nr:TonB-dependent receptor [Pseudoflavitalea sp. G-6-1-2]NML24111.1 TonB-dependent receptor [Pseudoflavitalea sp. G-6-1-2]
MKSTANSPARAGTRLRSIVKIAIVFLISASLQSFASGYSQKVSIKLKDVYLDKVFREIQKQTDYLFLYTGEEVRKAGKVSVQVSDVSVEEAMRQCLLSTALSFRIVDKTIVLDAKSAKPAPAPTQAPVPVKVSGIVSNLATKEPMSGVSVAVKGQSQAVATNEKGEFTIEANPGDVLVFSYVGFGSREVTVGSNLNLSIQLSEKPKDMSEIVVVGYGTSRKADLTGSVGTVNSAALGRASSTNLGQAVQGRMTGVQVTQSSGQPGSGADVKVRGVGSVKSGNSPLVLVDGFIGNLNELDADDVESVTVLKDASAASIYGSRAANGVMLVTTKKGKAGKASVEFKTEYGWQSLTKRPNYLTGPEWAQHQNEARLYNGKSPYWVGAQAPETITQWTDWSDFVFRTAPFQDYHLGITGGSDKTKVAVGLGYTDQVGTIIGTKFNRINARINLQQEVSKSIRAGVNISYIRSKYNTTITPFSSSGPAALNGITAAPPTIPVYNPDGLPGAPRPGYSGEQYITSTTWKTPSIAHNISDNQNLYNKTFGNVWGEVDIIPGLKYKLVMNGSVISRLDAEWTSKWAIYSPTDLEHKTPLAQGALASLQNSTTQSYVWEIQNLLTYSRSIGRHNFDALLGASVEQGDGYQFSASKNDFHNNDLRVIGAGNTMASINGGYVDPYSLVSQFARLNYSYAGRYLFQANVRRDGSSVFAPGKQYGVFPSFSAGWRISEEKFFEKYKDFVSTLKLRASWGQLGNAGIPAYSWISNIDVTGGAIFGSPQTRVPAYYPTQMENKDVKWETTTTTNIGLDLGFFNDKLTLEADYYDKRTTDMLLDATLPFTGGYNQGPVMNIGEVLNKGWELGLRYQDRISDFTYSAGFNLSHNKNEVTDLGNIKPMINGPLKTDRGLPINAYWGFQTNGIWRTKDDISKNPKRSGDKPGMLRFVDRTDDKQITDDDKTYIGSYLPKYTFGFNLEVGWKGFDFSMLIQGEREKNMLVETVFGANGEGEDFNIDRKYWSDRAIMDNNGNVASGNTPAAGAMVGTQPWSDYMVQDASYTRIKNMQLGYTLPKRISTKFKVQSLRVYVNATNFVTWTNFTGYDPEMKPSEPTNINAYSRGGVDAYPVSKTLTMGIRLVF